MTKDQIKTGAVLSYLQLFLDVLISLIIHPIIINRIGISENGIFHMAINAISYLNLLTLGLGSTFIRFYTKYRVNNDEEGEHKLNGLFLVFYLIIASLMAICGSIIIIYAGSIFVEFTANEIVVLKQVMTVLLVQSCVSLVASVFTMNINAREKFVFAKTTAILKSILLAISKIVIVMYGLKAMGLALVTIGCAFVAIIIEGVYALGIIKIKFKFGKVETGLIKAIFSFSFFIFLNQIIDMVNWQIDSLILGVVAGTSAVAIYSMASVLTNNVLNFSGALSSVLAPKVNRIILGGGSNKEINDMFIKTGRIQFVILAPIMISYIFFGKAFIVNFFANVDYLDTYYIGLLIILPLIVPLIQSVGVEIQRAYNKHQFRSIAYFIMAIVNLAMSIPLGMFYGGIGCAIGTSVSLIVGNGIIMNIYYHKKLNIDVVGFWKSIIKFVPSLILPTVIGAVLMLYVDLTNIWWFLLSLLCFMVVYLVSVYFVGLTKDERNSLNNKVKAKLHKQSN